MTWVEALVLGLVQGATEFLPVSSSGHLVMGQAILGVELPGAGFEVAVHLATVLSVLVVYRRRVASLAAGVARRRHDSLRYAGLLALASVPAAVAGVGFGDFLESLFDQPLVAGVGLMLSGCVVWSARAALASGPSAVQGDAERKGPSAGRGDAERKGRPPGSVGARTALAMGVAQALAIVPGVSRSGATVVAALWRGTDPREAAAFSFLMSVPAVGGAALLKLPDALAASAGASGAAAAGAALSDAAVSGVPVSGAAAAGVVGPAALLVAAATACLSGIVAVRVFRAMLRNRSFHVFAPYLWIVGALFVGFAML